MSASIRCFVFDFDGTLVDSNHIKRSAFYEAAAHIAGADAVLERIFAEPEPGDRYQVFAKLVCETGADAGSLADAYGVITEREILRLLQATRIGPFLEGLRARGYGLFIASATPGRVNAARGALGSAIGRGSTGPIRSARASAISLPCREAQMPEQLMQLRPLLTNTLSVIKSK